jgi:hypothetical protein
MADEPEKFQTSNFRETSSSRLLGKIIMLAYV